MFDQVEKQVQSYVEWLRLLVETLGALIIAAGVLVVVIGLLRRLLADRGGSFIPIRLSFARYPTLALALQLAAIAVIRTALNYFLSKELKDERASEEPAMQRASRAAEAD